MCFMNWKERDESTVQARGKDEILTHLEKADLPPLLFRDGFYRSFRSSQPLLTPLSPSIILCRVCDLTRRQNKVERDCSKAGCLRYVAAPQENPGNLKGKLAIVVL